ncbi:histidine phosphotransferase [Sulfitobacter sp. S0837]|uniref:histidine phosphotransferase family protein n=1 Tax=Sulfitobacter maritimus TaxID=2741719 RepID=UPI0015835795|nr:histidine phosphotransferase family protein [Sulfitobacter maritimus]NUH64241.1 histidine phosphotransferase [Sulfitobacter maritimus]
MGKHNLDLPALIGSRICHDLISPIGAINNGLELLNMSGTGAAPGPELALIGQSVESASARVRFFRIAFGAAGEQSMGNGEIISILRDLFADTRFEVDWQIDAPQPRSTVRMSFLALLCLETALHYGGHILIQENAGALKLTARADKIGIEPAFWGLLTDPEQETKLQPAQVQFALLPLLAADIGREIAFHATETELSLTF